MTGEISSGAASGLARTGTRRVSQQWNAAVRAGALALLALVSIGSATRALAQNIDNFAGNGSPSFSGDGGQATAAAIFRPSGIAFDAAGNGYIADAFNNRVRKVTPAGVISTFAGGGSSGLGDGGPAAQAMLNRPQSLAFDAAGNLYIGDYENFRIRRVDNAGNISTFAGNGMMNFGGENTLATETGMLPLALVFDASGRLLLYDAASRRVRRIGLDGRINTLAGNGTNGYSGDYDWDARQAKLDFVGGMAIDAAGNIFLADSGNNRIRRLGAGGDLTTIAGVTQPTPAPDGELALGSGINRPTAIAFDANGLLQFSENGSGRIRKIGADGRLYTVAGTGDPGYAGDGGAANVARLNSPGGLTYRGNVLYVADTENHRIRRISYPLPSAPVGVLATAFNASASVTVTAPVGGSSPILGYTVSSQPAGGVDTQAGSPATTHLVTGLANGTSYTFTATATNAGGTGPASSPSNAVTPLNFPGAPTIQSVGASPGMARVTFSPPADLGGSPVSGYTVTSTPAGGFDTAAGSTALTHDVGGLVNGVSYTFTVRATNAAGSGPASVPSTSVTPRSVPGTPPAPFATPLDRKVVLLVSAPATDGGFPITDYIVTTHPVGGVDQQAGTAALQRTITGLANGIGYTFQVKAVNAAGPGGTSPHSASVQPFGAPYAPLSPTATVSATRATVTFSPPADDGGSPVTGYRVVSQPAGGVDITNGSPSLSHVVDGLAYGTPYTFTVVATNAAGPGPASVATAAVTPETTVPGPPGMSGANAGNASAMVYFTPPANDGGLPIAGYTVTASPAAGTDSQANTTGLTHRVTGLGNGTAYTFTVVAHNAKGSSAPSAVSPSVTPTAAPVFPVLSLESAQVIEGTSGTVQANFVARLSEPAATNVTFNLATANGSAVAPSDYTARASTPMTLLAGTSSVTFAVNVKGDATIEPDEQFFVNLSNVVGATVANTQAIGVIAADETTDGSISTVAGNGTPGFSGDGVATTVSLNNPSSVAFNAAGDAFLVDASNNRIRKLSGTTLTTISGGPSWGTGGDGGPANAAQLSHPWQAVVGSDGTLFFTDRFNHCIRKISPAGIIDLVAGQCGLLGGYNFDDAQGRVTLLSNPTGLAMDAAGNLYVADTGNHRIRRLAPNGVMTTIVGRGGAASTAGFSGDGGIASQAHVQAAEGVAVDRAGNIYIADTGNHRIRRIGTDGIIRTIAGAGTAGNTGDGGPAANATLYAPGALVLDLDDTLYVSDYGTHVLRKIANGIITRISGTGVNGYSGDGGPAANAALYSPSGFGVSPVTGDLYVADTGNARVRRLAFAAPKAPMAPVAVGGNTTATVSFAAPAASAYPVTGYLVTSHPAGAVDTQAGSLATTHLMTGLSGSESYTFTVTATSAGGVSPASVESNAVIAPDPALPLLSISAPQVIEGDSGVRNLAFVLSLSQPTTHPVSFTAATGVGTATPGTDYTAVSLTGLVIPAGNTEVIVNVPVLGDTVGEPHETVPLLVSSLAGAGMLAPQALGKILNDERTPVTVTTVAGGYLNVRQTSGDGGPALDAGIADVNGLELDAAGNLYLADGRSVRRVDAAGVIQSVVGNPLNFGPATGDGGAAANAYVRASALAFDPAGNLFVSEINPNRVRKVTAGIINTLATTPYSNPFSNPLDMATDRDGNLYVSDLGNYRILRITPAGATTVLVGTGTSGNTGDGGPANMASIGAPGGIAIGNNGTVYFVDSPNARIRAVGPDGIVRPVAGSGQTGFAGDGGPATTARFSYPTGLAIDGDGNLYVHDGGNQRVRRISREGLVSTLVGGGSPTLPPYNTLPANSITVRGGRALRFDPRGYLYVSDDGTPVNILRATLGMPDAPTNVTAVAGSQVIAVSFTPPANDGGSVVTGYAVESFPAGGIDPQAGLLSTERVISGLQPGVSYTFRVRAINANGGSASQASNAVMLVSAPPTLAIAPVSVAEGHSGTTGARFTATLSANAPLGGVQFKIRIRSVDSTGLSATPGSDFVAGEIGPIRIDAGGTQAGFVVKVIGDIRAERDEIFAVEVLDLAGAITGDVVSIGTIVDDDATDPTLQSLGETTPARVVSDTAPATTLPPSAAPATPAAADTASRHVPIAVIQGSGPVSSYEGDVVRVRGIVTARSSAGLFIQSEDADRDADPATSEGLYLAWPAVRAPALAVGDRLEVAGRVEEVRHGTLRDQLFVTQLQVQTMQKLGRGVLPAPVALRLDDTMPLDWLERHEGMRVATPRLSVVAPVSGVVDTSQARVRLDGVFHVVAKGMKRPLREPGRSVLAEGGAVATRDAFDLNPERLRVDSLALLGARAIAVDAGDGIDGLVGVLDYAEGSYTLLPDPLRTPQVTPGAVMLSVSAPAGNEITVANVELRRLFDDRDAAGIAEPVATPAAYALRLAKAAHAICASVQVPDIVGVFGIEDQAVLADLAAAINANDGNVLFPGSCRSDPGYRAYLPATSIRDGQAFGVLVRTASLAGRPAPATVLSFNSLAPAVAAAGADGPRLLRVRFANGAGVGTELGIVFARFDAPDVDKGTVQARRRAQALRLATALQARQALHPGERLMVLGTFGSTEFGDDHDDLLGVVTGRVDPGKRAAGTPASPIMRPLTNLTWRLPAANRYTLVSQGDAQAWEHILVNQPLLDGGFLPRLEVARVNADFGEDNFADFAVPVRWSDRDPEVLYLRLPEAAD